jgi:hypothetical protein
MRRARWKKASSRMICMAARLTALMDQDFSHFVSCAKIQHDDARCGANSDEVLILMQQGSFTLL